MDGLGNGILVLRLWLYIDLGCRVLRLGFHATELVAKLM